MGATSKVSDHWTTVYPRIAKFYMDILAELVYSYTGYKVTSYFRAALGRISVAHRFALLNQLLNLNVWTTTLKSCKFLLKHVMVI